MISFTVNGLKIDNIYQFDDEQSILNKYALALYKRKSIDTKEAKSLQTSPRFLRFEEIQSFIDGGKYVVYDVRDVLKNMALSTLAEPENMAKLRTQYPFLNIRDIGLLWVHSSPYGIVKMNKDEFSRLFNDKGLKAHFLAINRHFFNTPSLIQKEAVLYIDIIEKELTLLEKSIRKESKIYKSLLEKALKPLIPGITKFNLEETTENTFLKVPNGESLYDIFNALDVSVNLPFVMLIDHDKMMVKIFDEIIPSNEWINRYIIEDIPQCIYFYVLDSATKNVITADAFTLPKLYSPGIWKPDNSVELGLKLTADESSDQLRAKIIKSLGGRIECSIGETIQMSIKGTFSINNTSFNPAIFADLVSNHPSFKYFIFFNEQKKSVLDKKRFSFYYQTNHKGDYTSALTITLTQSGSPNYPSIDIRIARAANKKQIDSFIEVFKHIYALYLYERDDIIKLYENVYPKIVFKAAKKIVEKAENKKSHARLLALQTQANNASAFTRSYSEKCQSKQQPYLVSTKGDDGSKLKNVKKLLHKKGGDALEKHGVIEWPLNSGDIYACYPREENEGDNKYIWAGIVHTEELDPDFTAYPNKPCCFLRDQYKKKAMKAYLHPESEGSKGKGAQDKKQANIDRPLGENKMAPVDRIADLPYYLQLVARSAGYKDIEDAARKTFLPIVRFGVKLSPNSLIHCLEMATNKTYIRASSDKRDSIAQNSLIEISKVDNFAIGKQEMFGLNEDDIRYHLSNPGSYIDPDVYVSILEKQYRCNIIIFKMNKDCVDGEVSLPRYANVHLARALNFDRKTVIIVKYGIPGEWPYQCELVAKYISKDQLEYSFESHDPLTELISKIRDEINAVYLTSPSGKYKKYVPLKYV